MRIALVATMVVGCGDNLLGPQDVLLEEPVAITVTRQSVPLADIPVVFHRADGTLVEAAATDANGRAAAKPGPGGFVTAVTTFAAEADLKTFAGVQPGDQLVLDGAPSLATPMTSYTVRVAQVVGAVFYRVSVRCLVGTGEQAGANTNPVDLSVTTTCLAPTETLVTALDAFGRPIESVLGAEATPTDGGVVDLTGAVPSTGETATLTLANVPADSMFESSRAIGRVSFLAEPDAATEGARPTVFPDHGGARQTLALTGDRPVFAWSEAATTQTLDFAAVRAATVNEPAVDRAARVVAWSGGADANFAFGQLFVMTERSFLWSYAGPIAPGTTAVTLPALDGFTLDRATRIDTELGVARIVGEALDELRLDGGWLDANNGLVVRPRVLFVRPPTSAGTGGFAFTTASLRF
jgi:hypothetical protein